MSGPRIAIVHEWLSAIGGAEMVLRSMLHALPTADVFTLVDTLPTKDRTLLGLNGRTVRTSRMQQIPGVPQRYRSFLPLMPWAARGFDLRGYDVVISHSHAVAHWVRVDARAAHLVHCCSPMRYAWDLRDQYLRDAGLDRGVKRWAADQMLDWIKRGDVAASVRPDDYVAISQFIADRVQRSYGRTAKVLYPSADTEYFTPGPAPRGDHYVIASRLVPYKRMPLMVEAFARLLPDKQLVVMGDGPDRARVEAALAPNVRYLGSVPRDVLREQMRTAKALLFAAEEDFGIVPVEAQACGTPVIAYGVGGARETVVDGETGLFFDAQTPDAIADAVRRFEARPWDAARCRANAERFSEARFEREFLAWIAPYVERTAVTR